MRESELGQPTFGEMGTKCFLRYLCASQHEIRSLRRYQEEVAGQGDQT
jgi:hypothetical protein